MKKSVLFVAYDWKKGSLDERVESYFPFDYIIDPKDFLPTIKSHLQHNQDYVLTDLLPLCDRALFIPYEGEYTVFMSHYARLLRQMGRPLFELDSHGLRGLEKIPYSIAK